jgi:preprotein translocase subunit SecY
LTTVPLPGLAPDAVARQLAGHPLREISVEAIGVTPVVDVMCVLFMAKMLSEKIWDAIDAWGSLRHQVWVAAGVLLFAAFSAHQRVSALKANGQLGHAAIDPYLVGVALVTGTAMTLWLGWLVSTYGFEARTERGWLFFFVADIVSRWVFRWSSAWHRVNPSTPLDAWPFVIQALVVVIVFALLLLLLRARRRVPLRVPAVRGPRKGSGRTDVLRLRVLTASPMYAAIAPSLIALMASDAHQSAHGSPLVDPAFSGLLLLLGIGSVAFFQSAAFDPGDAARNLQQSGARIPGVRAGVETAAYFRTRTRLLTAIAAPWFALLLAAPQLIELLLPREARVGLYGVQIVLIGAIVLGIVDTLGERRSG